MLQHVYECPHLSKGTYKCPGCNKDERISKFQADGCLVQRCGKDKLFTIANSLRLAKRIFSPHGPKGRRPTEIQTIQHQSIPQSYPELPATSATSDVGLSELPVNRSTSIIELHANLRDSEDGYIQELQGYDDLPAELHGNHHYRPAELDTNGHYTTLSNSCQELRYANYSTSTAEKMDTSARRQCSDTWPSSAPSGSEILPELRLQIPGYDYSSLLASNGSQELPHQSCFTAGPYRQSTDISPTSFFSDNSSPGRPREPPITLQVSPVESHTSTGSMTGYSSGSMESMLSPLTPLTPNCETYLGAHENSRPLAGFGKLSDPEWMFSERKTFGQLHTPAISNSPTPQRDHSAPDSRVNFEHYQLDSGLKEK